MGLEVLPDWFLLTIGITGIIGGVSMVVRWFTREVLSTWLLNNRSRNGNGHAAPPKACPLDSGFINSQLNNCEASREQAAMRDQQMLALLQQILNELQAIRSHEHDILKGITILLERNRANR